MSRTTIGLTEGSGVEVAFDEVTDVGHVQVVKIDVGEEGETHALVKGQQASANSLSVALSSDDVLTSNVLEVIQTEDAAHTSGDKGFMALAVRNDAGTALAGATGDYIPLTTNASGELRVTGTAGGTSATDGAAFSRDSGTLTPIGARAESSVPTLTNGDIGVPSMTTSGELRVAVSSGGILGVADDAAFTVGTTELLPIGMLADDTSPDSVNEGDLGAPRMSLDRKQYVIAHSETGSIYQGGTARTPTFLAVDAASSGDNTLLAAQGSGNKIRVHQVYLIAAGAVTARFESGAGGTALSGQMNLAANGGIVLPYSPVGWFETAANTLLNLELSGAVSVDGGLVYTVVT